MASGDRWKDLEDTLPETKVVHRPKPYARPGQVNASQIRKEHNEQAVEPSEDNFGVLSRVRDALTKSIPWSWLGWNEADKPPPHQNDVAKLHETVNDNEDLLNKSHAELLSTPAVPVTHATSSSPILSQSTFRYNNISSPTPFTSIATPIPHNYEMDGVMTLGELNHGKLQNYPSYSTGHFQPQPVVARTPIPIQSALLTSSATRQSPFQITKSGLTAMSSRASVSSNLVNTAVPYIAPGYSRHSLPYAVRTTNEEKRQQEKRQHDHENSASDLPPTKRRRAIEDSLQTPTSSAVPESAYTSATAKRILETLELMSSPVAEARRVVPAPFTVRSQRELLRQRALQRQQHRAMSNIAKPTPSELVSEDGTAARQAEPPIKSLTLPMLPSEVDDRLLTFAKTSAVSQPILSTPSVRPLFSQTLPSSSSLPSPEQSIGVSQTKAMSKISNLQFSSLVSSSTAESLKLTASVFPPPSSQNETVSSSAKEAPLFVLQDQQPSDTISLKSHFENTTTTSTPLPERSSSEISKGSLKNGSLLIPKKGFLFNIPSAKSRPSPLSRPSKDTEKDDEEAIESDMPTDKLDEKHTPSFADKVDLLQPSSSQMGQADRFTLFSFTPPPITPTSPQAEQAKSVHTSLLPMFKFGTETYPPTSEDSSSLPRPVFKADERPLCPVCSTPNLLTASKCVACDSSVNFALKPTSSVTSTKPAESTTSPFEINNEGANFFKSHTPSAFIPAHSTPSLFSNTDTKSDALAKSTASSIAKESLTDQVKTNKTDNNQQSLFTLLPSQNRPLCPVCGTPNNSDVVKCIACEATINGKQESSKSSIVLPTETARWNCQECFTLNDPKDNACLACTAERPGSSSSDKNKKAVFSFKSDVVSNAQSSSQTAGGFKFTPTSSDSGGFKVAASSGTETSTSVAIDSASNKASIGFTFNPSSFPAPGVESAKASESKGPSSIAWTTDNAGVGFKFTPATETTKDSTSSLTVGVIPAALQMSNSKNLSHSAFSFGNGVAESRSFADSSSTGQNLSNGSTSSSPLATASLPNTLSSSSSSVDAIFLSFQKKGADSKGIPFSFTSTATQKATQPQQQQEVTPIFSSSSNEQNSVAQLPFSFASTASSSYSSVFPLSSKTESHSDTSSTTAATGQGSVFKFSSSSVAPSIPMNSDTSTSTTGGGVFKFSTAAVPSLASGPAQPPKFSAHPTFQFGNASTNQAPSFLSGSAASSSTPVSSSTTTSFSFGSTSTIPSFLNSNYSSSSSSSGVLSGNLFSSTPASGNTSTNGGVGFSFNSVPTSAPVGVTTQPSSSEQVNMSPVSASRMMVTGGESAPTGFLPPPRYVVGGSAIVAPTPSFAASFNTAGGMVFGSSSQTFSQNGNASTTFTGQSGSSFSFTPSSHAPFSNSPLLFNPTNDNPPPPRINTPTVGGFPSTFSSSSQQSFLTQSGVTVPLSSNTPPPQVQYGATSLSSSQSLFGGSLFQGSNTSVPNLIRNPSDGSNSTGGFSIGQAPARKVISAVRRTSSRSGAK